MATLSEAAQRRLRTAVHEAGHAVAAVALGHEVKLATILADGESSGHIEVEDQTRSLAERAMVRLAGREAMILSDLGEHVLPGCREDLFRAHRYVLVLAEGDEARAGEITEELRTRTNELLFDRARELGEVSIALLEHDTLTADELRNLISGEPGLRLLARRR